MKKLLARKIIIESFFFLKVNAIKPNTTKFPALIFIESIYWIHIIAIGQSKALLEHGNHRKDCFLGCAGQRLKEPTTPTTSSSTSARSRRWGSQRVRRCCPDVTTSFTPCSTGRTPSHSADCATERRSHPPPTPPTSCPRPESITSTSPMLKVELSKTFSGTSSFISPVFSSTLIPSYLVVYLYIIYYINIQLLFIKISWSYFVVFFPLTWTVLNAVHRSVRKSA